MTSKKSKALAFWKKFAFVVFVPIPFILGLIGQMGEGGSFWNSAYNCLTMYLVDFGDPTDNVLIQVARWLAPMATVSGLTLVFTSIRVAVKRFIARCSKKSVGIFGAEPEKSELLRQLGSHGIAMDTVALRAGSYILVGSEEENLDFYQQNRDILKSKDVYLKCSSLPGQASADPMLHLFNPEETAARIFWKENCPYDLSVAAGHQLKIALFGFGLLGKELLTQGLQYNIFSPDQRIEYHIFGSDDGFTATHTQLGKLQDPVIFHDEPWYEAAGLIRDCGMLIVAEQAGQLQLLQDLISLFPQKDIHIFSAQTGGIALLETGHALHSFDWKAEAMLPENIRGRRTHHLAKKLNLRYAHLYNGVPETDEQLQQQWLALDTFTRYSNISSANYHEVCMKILGNRELTDEILIFLGELEHIRWCRYHYLNNWQQGIPENGKNKDPQKRIHALLIPNAQLSDAEKAKDQENVRLLMELNADA